MGPDNAFPRFRPSCGTRKRPARLFPRHRRGGFGLCYGLDIRRGLRKPQSAQHNAALDLPLALPPES